MANQFQTKNFRFQSDDALSMNIQTLLSRRDSRGTRRTRSERTPTAITAAATLPFPDKFIYPVNLDWSIEDKNFIQDLVTKVSNGEDINFAEVANTAIDRVKIASFSSLGSRSIANQSGQAIDPLKEIFFQGSQNRTYEFEWNLYPKNSNEAQVIRDMVDSLQSAASPDSDGSGILTIPQEFELSFPPELKIPKIKPCVCTSIVADYTGQGKARFQKDGYASFVKLTMALTELEVAIRADYQ